MKVIALCLSVIIVIIQVCGCSYQTVATKNIYQSSAEVVKRPNCIYRKQGNKIIENCQDQELKHWFKSDFILIGFCGVVLLTVLMYFGAQATQDD